jgi:hypothetical protein
MSKEGVVMHTAEVELIANRVAKEAVQAVMAQLPSMLQPHLYEITEKVSARNEKTFKDTLGLVLGVDMNSEDSIRQFRMTFDWAHEKRLNEKTDRRVMRSSIIKGVFGNILAGLMGGGIFLWIAKLFERGAPGQ